MSIIERMAEQQIIVISLLVTLIPFALAALLVLLRISRKFVKRLKQTRVRKRVARKQAALLTDEGYVDDEYEDDPYSEDEMQYEAAPPVSEAEIKENVDEEDDPEDDPEEDSEETEDSEEVSSEMMDLLNDVFVDEESLQRIKVLLQDSEDITAAELLTMTKNVAELVGIDESV